MHTAVLVEGESDRRAILALARRLGRDFWDEGIEVIAMGGAAGVEAHVSQLARNGTSLWLVGLCDANERRYFDRALDAEDIFVCDADLEDELIRAIGDQEIERFIESQGELKTFRTYQKQPVQREWTLDQQVHRFCGTRAGRKVRYAAAMVEWLPLERIPEPLQSLLDAV